MTSWKNVLSSAVLSLLCKSLLRNDVDPQWLYLQTEKVTRRCHSWGNVRGFKHFYYQALRRWRKQSDEESKDVSLSQLVDWGVGALMLKLSFVDVLLVSRWGPLYTHSSFLSCVQHVQPFRMILGYCSYLALVCRTLLPILRAMESSRKTGPHCRLLFLFKTDVGDSAIWCCLLAKPNSLAGGHGLLAGVSSQEGLYSTWRC